MKQHMNYFPYVLQQMQIKEPSKMLSKMIVLLLFMNIAASKSQVIDFKYNGFLTAKANMSLDGLAQITPNGILRLTNTSKIETGHAFYSLPIPFKDSSDLTTSGALQYIGLFNSSSNGDSTNHIVAIEFDTVQSPEFQDINDNHVGIDINNLTSVECAAAAYFAKENGGLENLTLGSGSPIQVWVEYSGLEKQINVTLSPTNVDKPNLPLLSLVRDLSPIIKDSMYVGFTSATGTTIASSHYVLGWSFKMNGPAQELDLSHLPKLPRVGPKKKSKVLTIGVPLIAVFFMFLTLFTIGFIVRRKIRYAEVLEDWEREYGTHRFSYKDLFKATKGFRDTELLGMGGFGMVYKGVLPTSNIQVAVKRVSHKSKQGMREFIAEIVSLGRLRHRNLVQLLGYCRRKGELLLVYDFMLNGSLDKFLFDEPTKILNWHQRFQIIKGVASGLLYLHEEWEQVVLHRDIKASNVLLDGEFNGRLGDFGLARLYDHGTDPQTTHVVGTLGYIAPEMTRTGKATTSTDVFAFGALMLEVASGKRPIGLRRLPEEIILVDWVLHCWRRGEILEARDVRLGNEYVKEEMELVLKLGLLCSHPMAAGRPSMRQVMQFLDGGCPTPELSLSGWNATIVSASVDDEMLYPCTTTMERSIFECSSSNSESLLSGGR
ncbi:L-type lectin-domain-containing protein [Cinnamomum micranthum f. kanehirae]|uniref:non-specific serine/threonine protein kinase n=1 Tax=Cinnamomum micranthum f. kanehirae TaxID=337451 RepID=A0A443NDX0_9MAGN|nr:L-type lectin-domain-containing protein [Cinnamomum micranthum f. kanehirae]